MKLCSAQSSSSARLAHACAHTPVLDPPLKHRSDQRTLSGVLPAVQLKGEQRQRQRGQGCPLLALRALAWLVCSQPSQEQSLKGLRLGPWVDAPCQEQHGLHPILHASSGYQNAERQYAGDAENDAERLHVGDDDRQYPDDTKC